MVFEISEAQQLSQTNIKTMRQRCLELITRAACIDQIRTEVIKPVLEFYSTKSPPKTLANDTVYLAWMLLRQGTMLCYLLNNLRSGILESFGLLKRPIQSETIFIDSDAQTNIKLFLAACRGDLYMTDDQLFPQASLYTDDTNTLSKAIGLTDSFFARIGRLQSVNYQRKFEQIQQDDCLFSFEACEEAVIVDPNKKTELRLCVIREMLETEQSYIADLDKLQSYAEELRIDQIVSGDVHAGIFANLDALVDFQRRFMLQMESKLTKTVLNDVKTSYSAGIGKLFIENEKGFAVYELFCSNQTKANNLITAEVSNLAKKTTVMEPNVVLRAYLIKPLQRICKYPLLIRELLKHSSADASDRKELEEASKICEKMAARVNEKKREEENAMIADELFSLVRDWKGLDKSQLGTLLLKETSQIQTGDDFKDVELYLFEHYFLVMGKSKSMADLLIGNKKFSRQQLVIKLKVHGTKLISVAESRNSSDGSPIMTIKYWQGEAIISGKFRLKMVEHIKNWISSMSAVIEIHKSREMVEVLATIKERRRRSLMAVGPIPSAAANIPLAKPSDIRTLASSVEKETIEPLRLKISLEDDTFVTALFQDIINLDDLKLAVLGKLRASYRNLNRPFDLNVNEITLKYYDDQKDLISLLDDTDVEAALIFNPTALSIKVLSNTQSRISHLPSSTQPLA